MTFITTTRPVALFRVPRWTGLRHALAVRRQRLALKSLDDAALADIGVTRAEAEAEARRPVWDAPETWRC